MITFVIFTYNEEARIERVIKNFQRFGKILLADNNSTDRTHEIAKQYGCDIYLRKEEYVFVENQQLVNQLYEVITTDWLYWGFADEMLDEKTLLKINNIIQADQHDIISMDRKNYFYGEFCYDLHHARTTKIFRKNSIDFVGNAIHGMGKPVVAKKRIYDLPDQYFIHHFISNTASSYLNVINRYTESELASPYIPKITFISFLTLMFKILIKDFIKSRGYKSGFSNLALSQLMLFYALVKNMKHFEKIDKISTPAIEERNNLYRDEILRAIESNIVNYTVR